MWYKCIYTHTDVRVRARAHTHTHTHTHTHRGILFSHKKGNEILPFARTWIEPGSIMLGETSHSEKGKYHMISLECGIPENNTNESRERERERDQEKES